MHRLVLLSVPPTGSWKLYSQRVIIALKAPLVNMTELLTELEPTNLLCVINT